MSPNQPVVATPLPTISTNSYYALARDGVKIVGTVITTLVALKLISGSDAANIQKVLDFLNTNSAAIIGAATTLGTAAMTLWTMIRAGAKSQAASVAALPQVETINMTTKTAADSVPAANVVGPK